MARLLPSLLILFASCSNFSEGNKEHQSISSDSTQSVCKIDYKQNIYNIFLGQTKDSLEKIVEIRRNFEVDRKIDADSVQHYIALGEELIKIVNTDTTDVLPVAYFTFRRGVLTEFECAIDYEPQGKNEYNIYKFISSLEPLFSKLTDKNNRTILSQKLSLQVNNPNAHERFYIDTATQDDLLFVYKINRK